jgi:hypothetical protein
MSGIVGGKIILQTAKKISFHLKGRAITHILNIFKMYRAEKMPKIINIYCAHCHEYPKLIERIKRILTCANTNQAT